MWEDRIAEQDWSVYEPVIREAELSGIRFALGGAFALAAYANHLRLRKSWVLPSERERIIQVVGRCGTQDFFPLAAYDRNWIYRSHCESQIVD